MGPQWLIHAKEGLKGKEQLSAVGGAVGPGIDNQKPIRQGLDAEGEKTAAQGTGDMA